MNIETACDCLAEAVSEAGARQRDLEGIIDQWRDRVVSDEAMPEALADEVAHVMTEAVRIIHERRQGRRSVRVRPDSTTVFTFTWFNGNVTGDFAATVRRAVESAMEERK